MKKILVLVVTLISAFMLVGCSSMENKEISKEAEEKDSNVIGNSSINIMNGGKIAYQDGWYYYYNGKGVYRIKEDGTEREQIHLGYAEDINVVGEWIYYNDGDGIARLKIDGSDFQYIDFQDGSSINVVDEWIYYEEHSEGLYKIKNDGTEKEQIVSVGDGGTIYINTDGEWIYYFLANEAQDGIYRVKIDGTENELLYTSSYFKNTNKISNMILSGEWIYFLKHYAHEDGKEGIYRLSKDGSELETVIAFEDEDCYINNFVLLGDTFFYGEAIGEFYKSDIEGKEIDLMEKKFDRSELMNDTYYTYYLNNKYIKQRESIEGSGNIIYEFYNEFDELVMTIE